MSTHQYLIQKKKTGPASVGQGFQVNTHGEIHERTTARPSLPRAAGTLPSRARKNRRSQEWTFPWEPRSGQSYHIRHMRHFRRYGRHHSRHYKILFFDLNLVFFLTRYRVHAIRKNRNQVNSHPERMYGFT